MLPRRSELHSWATEGECYKHDKLCTPDAAPSVFLLIHNFAHMEGVDGAFSSFTGAMAVAIEREAAEKSGFYTVEQWGLD